jgi:radical SAM superfamily enzyme YgiQ (UPF0313 family)
MESLREFTSEKLQISPEQVQVFTPTPSTYSSLMYYTEMNPFTGEKIFVEKSLKNKRLQKEKLTLSGGPKSERLSINAQKRSSNNSRNRRRKFK